MRIARLHRDGDLRYAQLEGAIAHALDGLPWLGGSFTGESWRWEADDLACPVAPSKIVCVGRNYAAHAKELGNEVPAEPLLFLKPPSALIGPGGRIVLPIDSERVEHEAELGIVIAERCKNVAPRFAMNKIFGYTCVGDITARDLQKKDVQFTRAKGFDTFCPVGPWIETQLDPRALRIRCRVNGAVRQDGLTTNMIFDVESLVVYVSRVMTLEAGDLIVTGTPSGVGPLVENDLLEIEIGAVEGSRSMAGEIGVLSVRVARDGAA